MNVERGPQSTDRITVESVVKGQVGTNGQSPNDILGPSLEYLISLNKPEDRDAMRRSYSATLDKLGTVEEKVLFIKTSIADEWKRNMP